MGVPQEVQDDDAEDALTSADRLVLMLRRLLDRPAVIVAVAVAVALVLAGTTYVLTLGLHKGNPTEGPSRKLVIDGLPAFEHSVDETYYMQEGEHRLYAFDFFHCLELPMEHEEIVVCFIDRVTVAIAWTDEPGERMGPVTWDNQPDTFSAMMYDTGWTVLDEGMSASNPAGGEGLIVLEWRGEGEYIENSWMRVDEHTWEGVEGRSYVEVRNGLVHWQTYLEGVLEMVEAGDQTHELLPVGYSDDGNVVRVTVTLGGRCVSLPPGSY